MILIQNIERTPNLSQSGKRDQKYRNECSSIGWNKTNTFKWKENGRYDESNWIGWKRLPNLNGPKLNELTWIGWKILACLYEMNERDYHSISMNDEWTWIGCIPFLLLPKPSTVVMSQPSQLKIGVTHCKKNDKFETYIQMLRKTILF